MNPLLESTYAAARRHCKFARDHEQTALDYASQQYMPGYAGRTARRLYKAYDEKRSEHIKLALICRAKATKLRRELARLASEDTLPPEERTAS